MTVRQYRSQFIEKLSEIYDAMEAENIFYLILEKYKNNRRIDLALSPSTIIEDADISKFDLALDKLLQHIPVQYVLEHTVFCGLDFYVNPSVLIPRPETEELVEWIVSANEFSPAKSILDIGTGSGCIAISVAKNLNQSIVAAIDVSSDALAVARINAESNDVAIVFHEIDILKAEELPGKFDIIVSNPPYVRVLEKQEMRSNVLNHEPHLALFVDNNDALLFYRKIANLAMDFLTDNGQLYFEINQYLAEETELLLKNIGFKNVEIRKDIFGNDRMIRATKI